MNRTIEWILSLFLIVGTLGFYLAFSLTHLNMTKEDRNVKKLRKVSFKQFKEEFLKVGKWEIGGDYEGQSLFSDDFFEDNRYLNSVYLHASIYRFGDVGYLMTPMGFFLAERLIRRTSRDINNLRKPYIK